MRLTDNAEMPRAGRAVPEALGGPNSASGTRQSSSYATLAKASRARATLAGSSQRPRASFSQPFATIAAIERQEKVGSAGALVMWRSKSRTLVKSSPQLAHSFRGFNGFLLCERGPVGPRQLAA